MSLLDIRDLTLAVADGTSLLHGISLNVECGETVGLVGESGSGKSLTARSVLGLLPSGARTTGSVVVNGIDALDARDRDVLAVRRHEAAMIFQDPRSGINPMRTIGDHMTESLRLCRGMSRASARERALELLTAVRLPRPEDHLSQYPHELSGGMLQRVMIAGALTSDPKLLVCDEPTTALDVTTQSEIVALLQELRDTRSMGLLFITHDLNLAASLCDRLVVMRAGAVEEHGPALEVLRQPRTRYTAHLVEATPSLTGALRGAAPAPPAEGSPLLLVRGVGKTYTPRKMDPVVAVRDASFEVPAGGALAIVGESGSGKSTLARMIVGLERADTGDITISGRDRTASPRTRGERRAHARSVQMVFQDPFLSLDPRISAGRAIADALRLHDRATSTDARARVISLLKSVGLDEKHATAKPRTLSGGQRQRVAIARALAVEPDVLVMDEATSALDVSVQAQVLDLVASLRESRGLTLLFISHDLSVVRSVCEVTAVMSRGEIVEHGPTALLLADPQHPYTQRLVASVPRQLNR
ncbi:peptide/nickel transport system ATP-binding protein [Microbacterium sp. cf046]|uniref:dipeptide ABC transporter ATP-binding protein n=1 Tax=Microbacterium sp. cf046 TaxID=1761803 RepID=UPI0008E9D64D|nr:ABC transporter ATP-binding protein [Microbacterium sp. cf046]SFR91798.1 peptide/nickel transport system ATP-binding protein [Microbacterium sp. cf046]